MPDSVVGPEAAYVHEETLAELDALAVRAGHMIMPLPDGAGPVVLKTLTLILEENE